MLTLDTARTIIDAARAKGRELGLKPLTVTVLDAGGATIALDREVRTAPARCGPTWRTARPMARSASAWARAG